MSNAHDIADNAAIRKRVRAERRIQRLRARFNLPDVASPEFIAEARRQGLAVSMSPYADDDQAFIDSISIWNED